MSLEAVRHECARSLMASQERRDSSDDHRTLFRNMDEDLVVLVVIVAILIAIAVILVSRL